MNLNQVTRLIVDALPRYVRFESPDGESTLSVEQVPEVGAGPGYAPARLSWHC
jgi:hypothetical protein